MPPRLECVMRPVSLAADCPSVAHHDLPFEVQDSTEGILGRIMPVLSVKPPAGEAAALTEERLWWLAGRVTIDGRRLACLGEDSKSGSRTEEEVRLRRPPETLLCPPETPLLFDVANSMKPLSDSLEERVEASEIIRA